jgi:hypothetical protein
LCLISYQNFKNTKMISFYHQKKKSALQLCEDNLTATLFDNLKHLPSEIIWEILKKALKEKKFPETSGNLISITFWDKWDPTDTGNKDYVEPDVFLRFEELDLVVEAKYYDKDQQTDQQIINEIIAYYNEYEEDKKKLYFLQLGGLKNEDDYIKKLSDKYTHQMCKTNWTLVLEQVVKKKDSLSNQSHVYILNDIIHGFALHQYYCKKWLKDLEGIKIEEDFFEFLNYVSKPKT